MKKKYLSLLILFGVASWAGAEVSTSTDSVATVVQEVTQCLQQEGLSFDLPAAQSAAIQALVKSADPQGRCLTDEEAAELREKQRGVCYDIDIRAVFSNGQFRIVEVREGTPAAAAGFEVGDQIQEIEKGDASSLRLVDLIAMMRGKKDSEVLFKIRGTNDVSREITVKRSKVEEGTVQIAEDFPAGIGYLKLNGLYSGSGAEVVSILRGWADTNHVGVILDLRGANGSDAAGAADVAGLFADTGNLLFSFRDAQDQDIEIFKAKEGTRLNLPAMVLLDETTSGSAELLAAALTGSAKGIMLIGVTTSADPLVREIKELKSGIKLFIVTRKLVVADGTTYNGQKGVEPALAVKSSALSTNEYEPEANPSDKPPSKEEKDKNQLRERIRGDQVLQRAVDILLGLKALNVRGTGQANNLTP